MEQSPNQPSAQETYDQHYDLVLDTLAAIKVKLQADHDNGQPKTWADTGNISHVVEELQDLARFLDI